MYNSLIVNDCDIVKSCVKFMNLSYQITQKLPFQSSTPKYGTTIRRIKYQNTMDSRIFE